MENKEKHLNDLAEIRQMMERSSRFLSLSGWAGISAGIFALLGAGVAYLNIKSVSHQNLLPVLLADAGLVLFLALGSSIYFSHRKAEKLGSKLWSPLTKKLLINMAIPMLTGGTYALLLLSQGHTHLLAGITLIFYGLALINAGRFVNRESVVLGLAEICLGLFATIWSAYGLAIWSLGFGVFHIIYGIALYYKYDRHN